MYLASRNKQIAFVPAFSAFALIVMCALTTSGCRSGTDTGGRDRVVVYTSVDQVFSDPIFRHCEKDIGLDVRAIFDTEETKSTGVLNRLIAEAGHPQADVFWSGDPVRPFLLVLRKQVQPYRSKIADGLPNSFKASDGTWTGFAARARVLLVNTQMVPKNGMPRSIRDLANPKWRDSVAMANPIFGTTTMHIAALFATWGDEKARAFLTSIKDNGIRIAASNGEVKRLVVSGEVAFGLTDTDDAYQAVKSGAPVAVIYPDQDGMGTLFMPTAVVLIRNGPNPEGGQRLIDCLLGADVEKRMADSAAHIPLRPGVKTAPNVRPASEIKTMEVDYANVGTVMERIQPWLRQWVGY
jgi:iron(III) transport system substrate-binding protein